MHWALLGIRHGRSGCTFAGPDQVCCIRVSAGSIAAAGASFVEVSGGSRVLNSSAGLMGGGILAHGCAYVLVQDAAVEGVGVAVGTHAGSYPPGDSCWSLRCIARAWGSSGH